MQKVAFKGSLNSAQQKVIDGSKQKPTTNDPSKAEAQPIIEKKPKPSLTS